MSIDRGGDGHVSASGPYVGLWGGAQDEDHCSYAEPSAVEFCD